MVSRLWASSEWRRGKRGSVDGQKDVPAVRVGAGLGRSGRIELTIGRLSIGLPIALARSSTAKVTSLGWMYRSPVRAIVELRVRLPVQAFRHPDSLYGLPISHHSRDLLLPLCFDPLWLSTRIYKRDTAPSSSSDATLPIHPSDPSA